MGYERLYKIVYGVLISYRPPELAGLREDREVYVQEFFQDKVYRLDAIPSRVHVGALKTYYVRYLRDRLDEVANRERQFKTADRDEEGDSDPANDRASDSQNDALQADRFAQLRESGVSLEDVSNSAKTLLTTKEPWVAVYLAFHFCPDNEQSEPLVRLARRLGISSYHQKAAKLGINWSPAKSGNRGMPFEETLIGRWGSRDLGIAFTPENRAMWDAALKILCYEALNWAEAQEAAQ